MSVECTSCGHLIPAGQFRCGKCGQLSPQQSMEDLAGLAELVADAQAAAQVDASARFAVGEPKLRVLETAAEPDGTAPPEPAPVKEPVVPKGTFASEAPQPEPTPPSTAREATQELRPIAGARETGEPAPAPDLAHSSSQRMKQIQVPVRPPFLASESLREDLAPHQPGERTLWRTLQAAGALGFFGNALVAFDDFVGWLCAGACASLVLLARLPLNYETRARLAAAGTGVSLMAVVLTRAALGAGATDALLVAACAVLPAALFFRAWYRGAMVARLWVLASLLLGFAWAGLTSHRGLLTLEFAWQSWVPALAWYVFGILCLLSLLAFMGEETTGGCDAWALGISCWFGLFACLRWALERDTLGASSGGKAAPLGLTEAALAAPFAVAIAQLAALLFVSHSRPGARALRAAQD